MIGRRKKEAEEVQQDIRIGRFSDFPEWVEAKGKLDALEAELRSIPDKQTEVRRQIAAYQNREEMGERVEALLAGNTFISPPSFEEVNRLEALVPVLRLAIDKQRMVVAEIEGRLSGEICEAIKPEYERRAKKLAECALAFQEAVEAEAAIREELILHDIRFTSVLQPCCVDGNRRQIVLDSITAMLNGARINGYLNEEEAS